MKIKAEINETEKIKTISKQKIRGGEDQKNCKIPRLRKKKIKLK